MWSSALDTGLQASDLLCDPGQIIYARFSEWSPIGASLWEPNLRRFRHPKSVATLKKLGFHLPSHFPSLWNRENSTWFIIQGFYEDWNVIQVLRIINLQSSKLTSFTSIHKTHSISSAGCQANRPSYSKTAGNRFSFELNWDSWVGVLLWPDSKLYGQEGVCRVLWKMLERKMSIVIMEGGSTVLPREQHCL